MKKPVIHSLHHESHEGLGAIREWANERGYEVKETHLYLDQELPNQEQVEWLIVMGGPMSVYEEDQYPWLRAEKELIAQCIELGKPVLGICLGAQLIADVVPEWKGRVEKGGEREVGFFKIESHNGSSFDQETQQLHDILGQCSVPLHWHGDVISFSDQEKVSSLSVHSYSDVTPVQAFSANKGQMVALQYHLEVTAADIDTWINSSPRDLAPGPKVEEADQIVLGLNKHAADMVECLHGLLDYMVKR